MNMRALSIATALGLAGALGFSGTASAAVSAASPISVVQGLQTAGYKAVLTTDGDGDPKIDTAMAGLNAHVYFYGCKDHMNCQSIQFSCSLDSKGKMTFARANDWNTHNRWLNMYLDKVNDPFVFYDLDTSPSGLDQAAFESVLGHLDTQLGNLKTFVWGD